MATLILSQDMLAICFLLGDGNIDLSIEEVISRAENYQEKKTGTLVSKKAIFVAYSIVGLSLI